MSWHFPTTLPYTYSRGQSFTTLRDRHVYLLMIPNCIDLISFAFLLYYLVVNVYEKNYPNITYLHVFTNFMKK